MKAHLMFRNRDFEPKPNLTANDEQLVRDLGLNILYKAMARDDPFLYEITSKTVLSSLNDPDEIQYRQHVLKDCIQNPSVVRAVYGIAVEPVGDEREYYSFSSQHTQIILSRSIRVMKKLDTLLYKLKRLADESTGKFRSEGFTAFFSMVEEELNDNYLAEIQTRLKELEFHNGLPISAELGEGNKSENLTLNKPNTEKKGIWKRLFGKRSHKDSGFTLFISSTDIYGREAMSELEGRALNVAANATAQFTDHVFRFFRMLRTELAFYLSCINLYEKLKELGEPVAFPVPADSAERRHSFQGLYDICLCLTVNRKIIGNDVNADAKDLVIVTGANQGGKSTFLRSIGLSQLMMQCGMFVPAKSYSANLCTGLFTHYAREEDSNMKSGKLEEELSRMSNIVEKLRQDSIVLFNESFSSTNEREGSELAQKIVDALLDRRVKVFFVTHFYELSNGFYNRHNENAIFLRAQAEPDGARTFKILEGEPQLTSYGQDLYDQIFDSKSSSSLQG